MFALQHDVSRLFPEKCNRKLGRRGITQNGAAGTIQAAGQVNRTDGNVAALERGHELGARTMQWTGEARTEQGIHHQTGTAQQIGGERLDRAGRSEEHTSELQSLMRISNAV